MKYICELCGMVYDEAIGDEKQGVPAGTPFESVPEDYECPGCGSEKEAYSRAEKRIRTAAAKPDDRSFWQQVKYSEGHQDSQR